VPHHVRVGSWSLRSDARQIDVAAFLDEQLAVGQDLGLRGCQGAGPISINGYVNKLPMGVPFPLPIPHRLEPPLSYDVLGCLIN